MLTDYTDFHGCWIKKSVFIREICEILIQKIKRSQITQISTDAGSRNLCSSVKSEIFLFRRSSAHRLHRFPRMLDQESVFTMKSLRFLFRGSNARRLHRFPRMLDQE